MKKYYEVKDMEQHVRFFSLIFEILYFSKKKLTFEEISYEVAMDIKNVRGHIQRMNELCMAIIQNDERFKELRVYVKIYKNTGKSQG